MSNVVFKNAEEAFFWAVDCEKAKKDGARAVSGYGFPLRPCNALDVFIVLQRLYAQGKIKTDHCLTLRFFGLRGMRPDPRIRPHTTKDGRDERRAYELWCEAMDLMEKELRKKGIVQ